MKLLRKEDFFKKVLSVINTLFYMPVNSPKDLLLFSIEYFIAFIERYLVKPKYKIGDLITFKPGYGPVLMKVAESYTNYPWNCYRLSPVLPNSAVTLFNQKCFRIEQLTYLVDKQSALYILYGNENVESEKSGPG